MGVDTCVYIQVAEGAALPACDYSIVEARGHRASLLGYTHTVDGIGRWPSGGRHYRWWDTLRPLLVSLRETCARVWCHHDAWWPGDAWDWGHDRHLTSDQAMTADFATCEVTDEAIAAWDREWALTAGGPAVAIERAVRAQMADTKGA